MRGSRIDATSGVHHTYSMLLAKGLTVVGPAVGVIITMLHPLVLGLAQQANSPQALAHAKLPEYNIPGTPLDAGVREGQALARAKGIPFTGIEVVVNATRGASRGTTTGWLPGASSLTCAADAIVVAGVESSAAFLSDNHATVFTDYRLKVTTVLKAKVSFANPLPSEIVLTRIGGVVRVNEGTVSFEHEMFPLLTGGKSYLLFLRGLPETQDFQAYDDRSVLTDINGSYFVASAPSDKDNYADITSYSTSALEARVLSFLPSCPKQ
jgi:hypothetical protein